MARRYTRADAARARFLRESSGVDGPAPFAMDPDGAGYDSDDLDRVAAAFDRYAREDADLADMADWRGSVCKRCGRNLDGTWDHSGNVCTAYADPDDI